MAAARHLSAASVLRYASFTDEVDLIAMGAC
jgi:hypothetical protein